MSKFKCSPVLPSFVSLFCNLVALVKVSVGGVRISTIQDRPSPNLAATCKRQYNGSFQMHAMFAYTSRQGGRNCGMRQVESFVREINEGQKEGPGAGERPDEHLC